MKLRRCPVVVAVLDEAPRVTLTSILSAGDGLDYAPRWRSFAPHVAGPVTLDQEQMALLQRLDRNGAEERESLVAEYGESAVQSLQDAGMLFEESEAPAIPVGSDGVAWWEPALVAQVADAWSGIDIEAQSASGQLPNTQRMMREHGPPPDHACRRSHGTEVLSLLSPRRSELDSLLDQRSTCRNFDSLASVREVELATLMYRVWGATGTYELVPGAVAVRKSSPAGGGLHCTEAYLLVQRAEGLQPGLYHYLALEHALEPLRTMDADEAAKLAHRFVAGQHWFANVPVMVIMVYRFDRLFWKYRRHSKAWRVAHLDVGHLSQTMYLSAADLGLGAFVTAAINDRDIDAELELPPLREASIAIVGFGPRAAEKVNIELDDLVPTPASQR